MNQISSANLSLEFREYKLPDDFPVLVLSPDNVPATGLNTTHKYHFHNCIEIGFCLNSEHVLLFENHEYVLKPGDFFVLSPFSMHYVNHVKPTDTLCCQYLYLKPEELLRDFYPLGLPEVMHWYKNSEAPFIFSKEMQLDIYRLLTMLLTEYHKQRNGYQYIIKGLFQTIMIALTRELSTHSGTNFQKYQDISLLLPALKRMHLEYSQPLNAAFLAEQCGLSQSSFRTLFRKHLGISHGAYLKRIRLQKACELLYGTELSILNISIESGFTSLTSFYQSFQEHYHISPKKWRDMYRSVQKKNISHSLFYLSNDHQGVYHANY